MSDASLFTADESTAVKSSWKKLTDKGSLPVGLLLFERLFTDVPQVRRLFKKAGIDADETTPDEEFTASALKDNETFVNQVYILFSMVEYRKKVVDTLDFVVNNLDNTEVIVKACGELGEVHTMYDVKPEHFDSLGIVLLNVLQLALDVELNHPTIQAWKKAYGAVSSTAKKHM